MRVGQKVEILNVNNGERFSTYIILGERGKRDICLTGAAARKVHPGDKIIIVAYATYDEKLEALLKLKSPLDKFFDDVFVNVDDKALKNNRKNLIGKIYQEFKTIADIKEITI